MLIMKLAEIIKDDTEIWAYEEQGRKQTWLLIYNGGWNPPNGCNKELVKKRTWIGISTEQQSPNFKDHKTFFNHQKDHEGSKM